MFQKLTSMFTGEAGNMDPETELAEKEDDDWILVDFIVDTRTATPEKASALEDLVIVDEPPVLSFPSGALEHFGNASDSYSFHFDVCPLEESWFVTPPPCFTAGDLTTTEVETSPMENLLIEHPSMSVYAVHKLRNKTETTHDSEFDVSCTVRLETERKSLRHHVRCYVTARAHGLDQAKALHYATLSKKRLEKPVNRKTLRRQNLIRGCHSHPIKQSGILVQQPCQRRYNY